MKTSHDFTPWQFGKLVFKLDDRDYLVSKAMRSEHPVPEDQAMQTAVIEVDITLVKLLEGRR